MLCNTVLYLQRVTGSLTGQTFVGEKFHLVTKDRFPWQGEVQKRNIMAIITRMECNYSVCTAVLWCWWSARSSCVLFVLLACNCQGHQVGVPVLVWIVTNHVTNYTPGGGKNCKIFFETHRHLGGFWLHHYNCDFLLTQRYNWLFRDSPWLQSLSSRKFSIACSMCPRD